MNFLSEIRNKLKNIRPKVAVMRIWYATLFLKFIYFILACLVANELIGANSGSSIGLTVASAWTAAYQIALASIGTFILKRLSTAFGIGFFIGLVVVATQQNILLFASFKSFYIPVDENILNAFSTVSLLLAFVYLYFLYLIVHYREFVVLRQNEIVTIESVDNGDFDSPYKSFSETLDT